MSPAESAGGAERLGGKHGIGRLDLVENRYVGMKSRGCYETPGGTIMLKGHRAIESITLDREVVALKDDLMPRYARMIYNGYWFSPERQLLQTLIDESQKPVNGTVRMKLYKGNVLSVGRESRRNRCSILRSQRSKMTRAPTTRPMPGLHQAQCAAYADRRERKVAASRVNCLPLRPTGRRQGTGNGRLDECANRHRCLYLACLWCRSLPRTPPPSSSPTGTLDTARFNPWPALAGLFLLGPNKTG